jgi:uncharacterized protein (DUF924 family)
MFFYMPLQHAESLEAQDEALAAFRRLALEAPEPLRPAFEECAKFASAHRDIIQRFGRFPHRNRVLGRANTREEEKYLTGGAENFGQG